MSLINNDKEFVDSRKSSKVEEVSQRDKVVKELLKKAKDLNLGMQVVKAFNVENADLQAYLQNQRQYTIDADQFLPNTGDDGGGSSNNLSLPMPHIVSKAYVARFLQAVWSIDPPFTVKARREDGVDSVDLISDLMRYTIICWTNHYNGLEEVVERWIDDWVKTGMGVMKLRWSKEYSSYVDVVPSLEDDVPQEVQSDLGDKILLPRKKLVEKEKRVVMPKFEGPLAEVVNHEDFIMVGGDGDVDKADMVMHRYFMTASELWSMVDVGKFEADAVEAVIKAGDTKQESALGGEIKALKARLDGRGQLETSSSLKRYEIIEAYVKECVDDTGINSDLVLWVSTTTGEVLRATYLYRVSPTGKRPFSVIHFHKRRGSNYGTGLLELMHPLITELNALHNIKLDFGMISTNPIFFYKSSSSLRPEQLQLEPGMGVPVDDPQSDVVFPQRPQNTGFFGNEEGLILSYIERLTGISDLTLGAMSGAQGAARTATGARAMITESSTNLDIHLKHLNRGWTRMVKMIYELLQQKVDGNFVFRVTGKDGTSIFRQVNSYDLQHDLDFEVSANSASSNKNVQLENAQQLIQITSNQLNLQLGISDAGKMYEAYRMYLNTLGIKDVHRFINRPKDHHYAPSPEEVFNRVVRGQSVEPNPVMDIPGIIQFLQVMLDQQSKSPVLDSSQMMMATVALRKFQSMKEALDAQENQAKMASQMRMNAAMSAQQAPAAMNPMEGAQNAGTT